MTKLLEQAIERICELPDADQDEAAELLLIVASCASAPKLDDATRAAVRHGLAQARRREFAADDEMAAIFDFPRREG